MQYSKPVISNQHGALVMALLPFLYAQFAEHHQAGFYHLSFGLAWFFLYLFSYPFFANISKKPTARNRQWAIIYFALSLISALPALLYQPRLLYFILPMLPLGLIQFYFAKKRDERNLLNDIAGILTFGIIGIANGFLASDMLNFHYLLHPSLFFIATTFYIKSMVRERKNPLYMELSIALHLVLAYLYWEMGFIALFTVYLFALGRSIIVPSLSWNVKQIGMFEFLTYLLLLIALIISG